MASTYSPLKIELIGTGEQVATWGQTTNTNLGTAIEQAIGGKADVTMSSTSETLTLTNTNALQDARALYLNLTGTPGGAATLNVPAVQKAYIVRNGTTGGNAVTVKVTGQTGVSVPNGATMHLYNNGTDVVNAVTNLPAGATIGGSAISTATGTVTSVAAGNGMSFSTITGTGSVTLGTPGTLSTTSTNAVAGSSHTHAITTASASTPSTIVARDGTGSFSASTISMTTGNITTATVTTGNITTGNINTLTVGTQTNKATISYTTNTARTLTIPNVGGNRTFAFLDQAQIFTADQSFDENVVIAKNCTIEDNLIFSGAGTLGYNRIVGEFGTPTLINRTYFQTIAPDTPTSVGAIPSGTAQGCSFIVNNNSTPTNATFTAIYVDDDECSLNASIHGSGTYLPLRIFNGGGGHIIVDPTGEIGMGTLPEADTTLKLAGRTHSLKADARVRFSSAYGYTVGATNRTLFIDNTGDIGGLSSTRESKTNIASIANADWLMSLEPVSYNRRERDEDGVYTEEYNPSTEFGLIADDVANVRPEICVFVDGKVSGINYEQLIAPMLKEIQNLRAEIAALKEKVNG
jgi:hypothetical protein